MLIILFLILNFNLVFCIDNNLLFEDITGYSFRLVTMLADYTWHTCPNVMNVCSVEMILTLRSKVAVEGHCVWHLGFVAVGDNTFSTISVVADMSRIGHSNFVWVCCVEVVLAIPVSVKWRCARNRCVVHNASHSLQYPSIFTTPLFTKVGIVEVVSYPWMPVFEDANKPSIHQCVTCVP